MRLPLSFNFSELIRLSKIIVTSVNGQIVNVFFGGGFHGICWNLLHNGYDLHQKEHFLPSNKEKCRNDSGALTTIVIICLFAVRLWPI